MLTITHALSNETTEPPEMLPGWPNWLPQRGFALAIFAADEDGRPWRISVSISDRFGFTGLRIDRTDTPVYRESDLDEDEASMYPPFRPVDPDDALAQISAAFTRAAEQEWTQVYTDHWTQLCGEYQRLHAILDGECRIEPYPW
jgi:hypothetical protein